MVPGRVAYGPADGPAEQQVVVDLLDQLPLAADVEQHPQQHCALQLCAGYVRTATADVGSVHGWESLMHLRLRVVSSNADEAQWVAERDEALRSGFAEQALAASVGISYRHCAPGLQLVSSLPIQ